MGVINQSQQSLDISKTPVLKEAKNDIIDKQARKKSTAKTIIKEPDIYHIIFTTVFPRITQPTNPLPNSLSNMNKSFENSLNTLQLNEMTIPITKSSHCSLCDDNQSVQSDLIDLDQMPIQSINNLRQEEKHMRIGYRLRHDYYARLIVKKVWRPMHQIRNHNTLFFFDWDDTLMCTSFLTPSGQFSDEIKISDKDKEKIRNLDSTVATIIQRTTALGDVFIVTNAAPGWVEYSSKKFYPETYKNLLKANVISARGSFEKKYPGDNKQWKVMAFLDVLTNLNTKLITNLICFGDSIIEIEAAHTLGAKFPHVYIKTVKFKENPMPVDLHKQLNLIVNQLDKIYSSVKNLTIRVEKKKNEA